MNKIYLFLLFPFFCFGQTQIGADMDGESTGDESGEFISISSDGSIIAIGARNNDGNGSNSGHVRVYQNNSGTWTQIGQDINGEAANDTSGRVSLSSDGLTLAVGAPLNDGNGPESGHVRVFQYVSGNWIQIGQDINGENTNDVSGSVSLSADGTIVAIGAGGNDGNSVDSGHVRIYKNISGVWSQIGQDINGEAADDDSGITVSLSNDGTVVAIGADRNDGNGVDSGHVRVYKNISNVWTQIGQDINGEAANDLSSGSLSLSADGSTVAIGSRYNNGPGAPFSYYGHVRIYKNISGVWTQVGQDIDGEVQNYYNGWSVSLSADGTVVAISAVYSHVNGFNSGQVKIYKLSAGNWLQIGNIAGEAAGDLFGSSVSLSSNGHILAVGARKNGGNGINSGHVRVFDLSAILNSNSFIQSNFKIYPNPTSEILTIELENNLILEKVNIYNTLGQIIKTENNTNINVSKLQKGTYFVEVITNQGKATKSIIVN